VRAVLAGEPGPRRDIVLLNAAAALWVAGAADGLAEGLSLARRSLEEGAAAGKLALLAAASRGRA
jgi:anthranilate phosphoribosyltransferase